jgi:subtilisin-like proprotein convertase family protein
MPTRFSKLCFLFALVAASCFGVFSRPISASLVISKEFELPIPSPDDPCSGQGNGRMVDAIIDVTEHILITDVNIAVTLSHEAFFDLQLVLVNPAGTAVTLNPHSNYSFFKNNPDGGNIPVCGTNRFLFDDEATIPIEQAFAPWNQPFKPYDKLTLSAFDNQDAFGQWRLRILDFWPGHTGQLHEVELMFNSPEPASICLFAAVFAAVGLRKNNKVHCRK